MPVFFMHKLSSTVNNVFIRNFPAFLIKMLKKAGNFMCGYNGKSITVYR